MRYRYEIIVYYLSNAVNLLRLKSEVISQS